MRVGWRVREGNCPLQSLALERGFSYKVWKPQPPILLNPGLLSINGDQTHREMKLSVCMRAHTHTDTHTCLQDCVCT